MFELDHRDQGKSGQNSNSFVLCIVSSFSFFFKVQAQTQSRIIRLVDTSGKKTVEFCRKKENEKEKKSVVRLASRQALLV
jgi:hypothetical protein